MPMFREKRRVRHGPDEMFGLVADMERYPEFLPLCESNVVRSRSRRGDAEVVVAEMTVAYKFFRESFRSRVTLDKANRRILIDAQDGPLRELRIRWGFKAAETGGCEVEFHLSYELPSRVLARLVGSVLDTAFSCFVEAFERRANALHARAPAPIALTEGKTAPLRIGICPTREPGAACASERAGLA